VELRLELIVLPVSDIDRAKAFYESAGFLEEFDAGLGASRRVVQLRPPGSPTSILIGNGVTDSEPGSMRGLQLLVADVEAARAELVQRGIEVGPVFHDLDGAFYHASPAWEVPGRDPAGRDHSSFARFADPDGNEWVLHEADLTPSADADVRAPPT
jgi:catechol 2,3-dioxygenase-like lactoylglutathione lyase family enzyme